MKDKENILTNSHNMLKKYLLNKGENGKENNKDITKIEKIKRVKALILKIKNSNKSNILNPKDLSEKRIFSRNK